MKYTDTVHGLCGKWSQTWKWNILLLEDLFFLHYGRLFLEKGEDNTHTVLHFPIPSNKEAEFISASLGCNSILQRPNRILDACRKHTQKPIWRLQMMVSKGKLLFQIPLFVFGDVTVTIQLVHFDKPRKTGERLQQCFLLPFSTLQNWPSRDDLE